MIKNAEQIKEEVDIKDILIAEGITVDSKGKCACPVHQGKNKNFSIKDKIGTCFSQCGGQSWDAVGLLMELHPDLTYHEALEYLAKIGNVHIEYTSGANAQKIVQQSKVEHEHKTVLIELTQQVFETYFNCLNNILLDTVDFDGREFNINTIKRFGICYTGTGSQIHKMSGSAKWNVAQLIEVGILKSSEKGVWDVFQNRFLFPKHDEKGTIVGFGARKTKADINPASPKYVNSCDSLLYHKEENLYGLYQNKREIQKLGYALLFEGYTDVATSYDYGIRNTVACCGTALTEKQAKLLKKYTDRVVMIFDGDEAGQKAARRSTEILLNVGMHVEVLIMKDGDDPDSFLRKYNREMPTGPDKLYWGMDSDGSFKNHAKTVFEMLIESEKQNALLWMVMENYSDTDLWRKEQATTLAADLLCAIDSTSRREEMIAQICKKTKIIKKVLIDLIKEKEGHKLDKKKVSNLTPEQQRDIQNYGVYIDNFKYFAASDIGQNGWEISNFVIRPIMLVIGSEKSLRLVEVKNSLGRSFIADIESDSFVELNAFKKEIARKGNYLYTGKPELFIRIQAKIYAETPECYPVQTLGWHSAGFWTWGNGISVGGEFKPVNEYGIVEYNDNKYYLPAFSKIQTSNHSDDEENRYEDEKEFIYVQGKTLNFNAWTRQFIEVHGNNGMMGVSWFCAATFRDIIYNKFNYFPHLNLFGPPGAGKSFMAWSLQAMFGKPKAPFHLVQGTNVGFFRRLAKVRNGISWFDEYSNDVPFQRIEALKAAYDGVGHEKGDKDNAHSVIRTKVKSACVISGQQQPTQDVALFKRCISLNFPRFEKSDTRDQIGRAMRDIEQENRLGQITGMLQKFRPFVEENFAKFFDEVRSEVSPILSGENTVEDRILNNHLIPLTIYKLLSHHIEFSFSYDSFRNFIVNNIVEQSRAISNEDELSVWWKMIQYLAETNNLKHYDDFIVQECESITILQKSGKGTETRKFNGKKTCLFLRFEKSHPLYLEFHKRQYSKNALPESSLKYYLRGSSGFVGEVKAKKFRVATKCCWVFDMDEIGLNLPLSLHCQEIEVDYQVPIPDKPIERTLASSTDDELPF